MQIVSSGDNSHEMLKPCFLGEKRKILPGDFFYPALKVLTKPSVI